MSRRPDILPPLATTPSQELKVMTFWREGERSINNLVKRSRVKSDQVWAVLNHYGVAHSAKP